MTRFTGVSGVKSREWRKLVASFANSKKDYVRTIKFPLETPPEANIDFGKVTDLFEVTEGTSEATLFGILISTHLAGFRFFPNARQTLSFRELGDLESEFSLAWREQSTIALKLSPSVLIEFAKTPRRKVKGVTKEFNDETVMNDFSLKVGISNADRNSESAALSLATTFTEKISSTFSSWADMNESATAVLDMFDKESASNGFSLPQLKGCLSSEAALTPSGSTIAFDRSLLKPSELLVSTISIHQVVAQKIEMLRRLSGTNPTPAEVQSQITTATNNALSWLFGTGFLYWRETQLEQVISDFNIPEDCVADITFLQSVFKKVPNDALFSSRHYADFRSSVGGKLDSWIANYVSQLLKIQESLQQFESWTPNEQLGTEPAQRYFRSLGLNYDDLLSTLKLIESYIETSNDALTHLLGMTRRLPEETDVNHIENFSEQVSSFVGSLSAIKNAIAQDVESGDKELVELAKHCDFQIPKWLKPLPRVNQISGGTPDIQAELTELENDFKQARALKASYREMVLSKAAKNSALVPELETQEQRESELLAKREMPGVTANAQAKRNVLNRLCGLGKNGSDFLKQVLIEELSAVFVSKKDLRRLLNNGLGAIYVSPFSTYRHQPLRLDLDELERVSPLSIVTSVKEKINVFVKSEKDFFAYRDLLRLEDLVDSLELSRLPNTVPSDWLPLSEIREHANVPVSMVPLLESDEISRQTVIKLTNLLTAQLNGALSKAFRESFFVRTKFMRVGFNELHWVPKSQRPWHPPKQVETSQGELGKSVRFIREKTSNPEGSIDSSEGANAVLGGLSTGASRGSGVSPILQQMPHDWFLDLKIASDASELEGFGVDKERITRSAQQMQTPCRLIGASASKTMIDKWLTDVDVKIGEHNLLFEQHYKQTAVLDEDLNPKINIETIEAKAELALTITDGRLPTKISHPLEQTVVGIDLGEAGIGYSVFKTIEIQKAVSEGREPEPTESGSVPIRSVRDLIKRVKRHRKIIQPRQRFRQGASTALEQLRNGALGDVCYVIDALCAQHKGFPVLETSVANLASGGKQLQLIYDKIVHTYFFSDIDAHKAARRHHWAGAEKWEHPSLAETERKLDTDGRYKPLGKSQPLKLHPGSAVHPAGTSQVCSACYRNPYKAVDDSVADDGQITFDVKDARVEFADGTKLLLLSTTDASKNSSDTSIEMKKYVRLKERAPFQYPVSVEKIDQLGLKRHIRRQLRQGQKSTRSKDTTQSAYSCVFDDCGHSMHADENAAINIVRKWVRDKGIH